MKVGIPRSFLYYKYGSLWDTFFKELNIDVVYSEETTKEILKTGINYADSECCLSFKIYLGHVFSLIGKCDYILIPRIGNFGNREEVCTKFQAVYDVVVNTFPNIKVIDYNIDIRNKETEYRAFMKLGKKLKCKKVDVLRAYFMAKQREITENEYKIKENERLLKSDNLKILLIGHAYNIEDPFIGGYIKTYLEKLGCVSIIGDYVKLIEAKKASDKISPTLPWTYSKHLLGSISLYKEKIDGIILITAFPCGPDSLVNDIIIRKIKDKPILNLIVDEQEGKAGIETRLESFIDIIEVKKEVQYEKKS